MSKLALVVLCLLWCEIRGQPATLFSKHVDIADVPYHVSVRRAGQHVCSGALVHESWIITAASCVYDSQVPLLSVLLGSSDLEDTSESAIELNVSKIVVHQNFDRLLLTNNVALVKVKPAFILADWSPRPILLPSSANYHLKDGSLLLVSGWKKLQDRGGFESQLSVTGAPLVNQRTCIRSMPSYKAVSGKMLCAGYTYPNAGETCQGDVGAPLANDDILLGILASAEGCSNSSHPGVYTKIASFLPWISRILELDLSV